MGKEQNLNFPQNMIRSISFGVDRPVMSENVDIFEEFKAMLGNSPVLIAVLIKLAEKQTKIQGLSRNVTFTESGAFKTSSCG